MADFPNVIELLQKMVGFDTVNSIISGVPNAERPLAIWLEEVAQNAGLHTQRLPIDNDDFNLLVTHESGKEKPWIFFESHLDVVSVDGMTIEPFAAKIENGKMWGRGSCDTKATGAAMLCALREYSSQSSQPNNIGLLFACDEEVTKRGATAFAKQQLPQLGYKPVGVIVGEPTMLQPVVAHNGVARITVSTHGVAAHSSDPSKGRSAISAMVKVIELLESEYIPSLTAQHPLTGKAQSSINMIRGGTQFNIIPDHCEIGLDRRLVPGENPADVLPAVQMVLAPLKAQLPDAQIEAKVFYDDAPLAPSEGEFTDFVNRVLGDFGDVEARGVPYGTDASSFALASLPAIVLGPGDIAQAHTKDEWIELTQVEKAVQVYGALMSTPFSK
jgi:acetylornithine deacetylase